MLIDRNIISRKEISTQRIREWMAAHPDEAAKVRAANRSYMFFRVTGLSNDGEPVGAQGVPLTPGRSIAVDRVHEYGTPFFIEANLPIESAKPASPFRRLMIAQDTGSAIVGPARADLYWGAGEEAGRIAGRIRHPGRFVMLLPRELDMVAAGSEMPLPVPKPKIAELEVGKQGGKGKAELGDTGGKGKVGLAGTAQSPPARPFHRRSPNRRSRRSASRRRITGARLRARSGSRTTRARPILPMPARAQPAGRCHRLCQTRRSPYWTARNTIANARQTGRTPARARPASPSCCRC